ncbi:MAG TPA: hypothetical protein ACFYD3_04665 [Candidatus Hypogeohydataceae bacterium YC41]
MYEIEKIKEAEYFYNRMIKKAQEDSDAFKYNLSAFLAAARSVLQFAQKEVQNKPEGQRWYESVVKNEVVSFFKNKRNINIHKEPVKVLKDTHISCQPVSLSLSLSASIIIRDKDGNITYGSKSKPEPPKIKKEEKPTEVTYRYRFDDWAGIEDVPTLCCRYLDELRTIVADGQKKGFLS